MNFLPSSLSVLVNARLLIEVVEVDFGAWGGYL